MKWVFAIMAAILTACQTAGGGNIGVGPVTLSGGVYRTYQTYLENDPLVFAISEDGRHATYFYCQEVGCEPLRNIPEAIARCEERSGRECRIFAIRDEVVWNNPGSWRPLSAKTGRAEADDLLDTVVIDLGGRAYSELPGHRALAISIDPVTLEIVSQGFAFGHGSARDAVQSAIRSCALDAGLSYQDDRFWRICGLVEANGRTFWPRSWDDLSRGDFGIIQGIVSGTPSYIGRRSVGLTLDEAEEIQTTARYEISTGTMSFTFSSPGATGDCEGRVFRGFGASDTRFELKCDSQLSAKGTVYGKQHHRRMLLRGEDSVGERVRIVLENDGAFEPTPNS